MKPKFYSLFYIDTQEKRQLQGKNRTGNDRLKIFLKNAATLDMSLRSAALINDGLTILTNNSALVNELLNEIDYPNLKSQEIEFSLDVPKGIRFYSAHYKIDAFKYFSQRSNEEYSILLDNDIVALSEFPKTFYQIIDKQIPLCYYIYENTPDRNQTDCRRICPDLYPVQWTGGEFWGGVNSFYSALYQECKAISTDYFKLIDESFCHIGDEMLTAIAIAKLKENQSLQICDAGIFRFIYRYWGMHETKLLRQLNATLVHLPADKIYIANQFNTQHNWNTDKFIKKYERHIRFFKSLNTIRKLILRN